VRTAEEILAEDRLWTVPDVARFLSMSTSWVSKRAADGTLPTLRIGRAVRFEPEAVRSFARGESDHGAVLPLTRPGTRS